VAKPKLDVFIIIEVGVWFRTFRRIRYNPRAGCIKLVCYALDTL